MLPQQPLVSVVMPVYNGGLFLQESIDSILAQKYRHFEFIIVNDGSTDHTESIILSNYDDRIRYFRNETNKGLIYSLNYAIDRANGEYIARIDADDVAITDRIENQIAFLLNNTDYGICGTNFIQIDRNGKLISKVSLPLSDEDAQTLLFFGNVFCHSSMMIRANLIRLYQYRDEYLVCEDYDLWSRIAKQTKVANLPGFSTLYRMHGNNFSVKERQTMNKVISKINERFLKEWNIQYTQDELIIHANFLQYNYPLYKDEQEVADLQRWLIKLIWYLEKMKGMNNDLAMKSILSRWISICFNVKNYKMLLFNPFFQRFRALYLKCMMEKIFNKMLYKKMLHAY
jgi:glycosyltransferase involved in cell wall biosynthesis